MDWGRCQRICGYLSSAIILSLATNTFFSRDFQQALENTRNQSEDPSPTLRHWPRWVCLRSTPDSDSVAGANSVDSLASQHGPNVWTFAPVPYLKIWRPTRLFLFFWRIKPLPHSSVGKESTCNVGDLGSILGREAPLEKEMATHSSVLAWRIPWSQEPGGLQFMGSQESDTT